ncbi:hypothetical protein BX600DRAFT_382394 [Xylariales sp. PMI_506]|nr:hypothetical protein BX600DRAFT_382394 [Xylariales sp. PMI_506]
MDVRPTTADSKHHYPPQLPLWHRSVSSPVIPRLVNHNVSPISISITNSASNVNTTAFVTAVASANGGLSPSATTTQPQLHLPFPTHLDLLPILLPQQSSLYQAQLLQYNKLVAPERGRGGGLHTSPLPPLLSTQNINVGPRSRASSKVSNKDSPRTAKPGTQNCHGNRGSQTNTPSRGDRAIITGKDKMPPTKKVQADTSQPAPSRPIGLSKSAANLTAATHSNSVPSTPHQHARKFSFESREPSPNANHGHSPRSAYSETNGNVPSLRPLPPRSGGCQYETIPERSRRRIPYNIGSDWLEKSDLAKIKSKLSEDDERKLTTDMRELYDRLKPTDAVEEKRQKLVQKLEKLLNDTWPGHGIRVHLFGSSGNMLCSDDSDVDICITTPWKELEGVCKLAELLAKHGMEKVVCVSSAKVPIVKIWDPELELACDMNVNNTLALENTRMIRTYIQIDERIRPLAMIIKYWTRRRIINVPAFGGTLSSYTWICMIIAFLQLLDPPVLPALHQRAHQNLGKREGDIAPFGDDVERLRGFGNKNKSTLGELLFQFFRFYAHEFDYNESALSVRLGRLMPKTERKHWVLAPAGRLCVEEPFNTMRNLGNTADDTSFRGIHLELRRAFDLISEGKLNECCEQFIFPKEEERIWQKPAAAPRPVLLRSASQQHNGRGSRNNNSRGGRQQGQYRNGNNNSNNNNNNNSNLHANNRRASSSTAYDANAVNNLFYPGYAYMGPDGMYMQASPEVVAQTLSALQLRENNLRFLQYTQNQAIAQQQALAHAQRMQGNVSQTQSSSERSRTNSFDNPPMTAPIRPEMWYWQQLQGQAYFGQPSFTSYPSSPSNGPTNEQRRASHRSTTAAETGSPTPGSTLRSQSQPASRSLSASQQPPPTFSVQNHSTGAATLPTRQVNGRAIPSFIPDEGNDTDQEASAAHTPPDDKYLGYLDASGSPGGRRASAIPNGLPAFGDIGLQGSNEATQPRRRPSSEQFPHQAILDRIKRSPSPLTTGKPYPTTSSSASLTSAPVQQVNTRPPQEAKPVVVNGSVFKTATALSSRQPSVSEVSCSDLFYDNPLNIGQRINGAAVQPDTPTSQGAKSSSSSSPVKAEPTAPVVVNGSSNTSSQPDQSSPRPDVTAAALQPNGILGAPSLSPATDATALNPVAFQRLSSRQTPSPLIAQLDLATDRMGSNGVPHLSPVYETTPSPTVTRRFDLPINPPRSRGSMSGAAKEPKQDIKVKQKLPLEPVPSKVEASHPSNSKVNGFTREHGHTRGAKSESDNTPGGWQKIGRGKKKGQDIKARADLYPQSEQLPKDDSERKGG